MSTCICGKDIHPTIAYCSSVCAREDPNPPIVPRDDISNPRHYTRFSIEPIDAIESWDLNFRLANVVKYVARANHKGQRERDLRKAIWYLERELSHED